MVENYLLNTPWVPIVLFIGLYLGDYYLTIIGAKMYKKQPFLKIEGSYELTPQYQQDIDQLRLFSFKLVKTFLIWGSLLLAFGYVPYVPKYLFGFLIGFLLFTDLGIYIRHASNIHYYSILSKPDSGVLGQVTIPRPIVYKNSAFQLICMGVFTLIAWALTMESSILFGGGIGFISFGIGHYRLPHQKPPGTIIENTKEDIKKGL